MISFQDILCVQKVQSLMGLKVVMHFVQVVTKHILWHFSLRVSPPVQITKTCLSRVSTKATPVFGESLHLRIKEMHNSNILKLFCKQKCVLGAATFIFCAILLVQVSHLAYLYNVSASKKYFENYPAMYYFKYVNERHTCFQII